MAEMSRGLLVIDGDGDGDTADPSYRTICTSLLRLSACCCIALQRHFNILPQLVFLAIQVSLRLAPQQKHR